MFRQHLRAMTGYQPGEPPRREKVIKRNTTEKPYPRSPKVIAPLKASAERRRQKYPDPIATAFRERAAALLAGRVPGITADWILCRNGSDDILTIVTRPTVGEGDVVRFAQPSYVLYKTLAEIQGAKCDIVDFAGDWSLGEEFTRAQDRLKIAFLPNPNSPSGTVLSIDRVHEI